MNAAGKKILIVGLFLSPKNKHKILRTAADQLAELLVKNGIEVITVSTLVNQAARLLDTFATVIAKSGQYKIAVVPVYANRLSYIWEITTTKLLQLLGKKIVLVVHGGRLPAKMQKNAKKYLPIFRAANLVVCPSDYLSSTLRQYGVESQRIENVINLHDYVFHTKEKFRCRIFWMRTLEDVYNPEMAVRVAALLAKRYADFSMVMAGYDRGSLAMVQQLAKQLQVDDKISFPGYITNEQKNKYAEELDIYICTNRIDNAPVSLIEMMAMGLPVVSVNTGGIPFLVTHQYNGLLSELDDDIGMVNNISRLVDNAAFTKTLVDNGRHFAAQFGEAAVIEKWKGVFKELGNE